MALTIRLDFPPELERRLLAEVKDLDSEVKQAYAIDLFRKGTLSHRELSQVLGLDRFETDAYLQRHQVLEGSLTLTDLQADYETLTSLFNGRK